VSELRDIVLGAIDGGARDRDAIMEATGLEHRQVTNLLFNLKAAGSIVMDDDGYSRTDGAPPAATGADVRSAVDLAGAAQVFDSTAGPTQETHP
jgi:hypothetical protein